MLNINEDNICTIKFELLPKFKKSEINFSIPNDVPEYKSGTTESKIVKNVEEVEEDLDETEEVSKEGLIKATKNSKGN